MDQQRKVEDALTDATKKFDGVVEQLDKDLLRKAKADMFRCSAKCCDDLATSIKENQKCTENCARKILKIQQMVQDELVNFQERLDRAARTCQDNLRDQITSNTSELERSKFQRQYENCVSKHVDDHILKLPQIIKKLLIEGAKIQNS